MILSYHKISQISFPDLLLRLSKQLVALECVKKKNFVIHDIEKRNVCCMKCVMCIIEKRMSNLTCLFYHDENILKDYLKKKKIT